MSPIVALADVEGATRAWMRRRTEITNIVGNRSFLSAPDNVEFPCIFLHQIGGGLMTGYAPVAEELIQFDCLGTTKSEAKQLQLVLCALLTDAPAGEQMDDDTVLCGASVDNVLFLPDPAVDRPRYIVTSTISAQRTAGP